MTARAGAFGSSAVAVLCLIIGLFLSHHMAGLVEEVLVTKERKHVLARLSAIRAHIEGELAETVALGAGIRSYTRFSPGLQQGEFEKVAAATLEANPSIMLVGLAPDNILQFVYPLGPNRKALGLNYRTNPQQWPSIVRAIETRSVVVSGPVDLVQGGRALVIRVPIFLEAAGGQVPEPYWGVATLVLNEERLFEEAGVLRDAVDLNMSIVKANADRPDGDLIFRKGQVTEAVSVQMPVDLPGGAQWRISAHPPGGWLYGGREVWMTRAIGAGLSGLFALMVFLLVFETRKVWSMALHDPLTGLANRRLLEDRVRQLALLSRRGGPGFEIFYVDLDGFKPVNDNYGHQAGDRVLIEVAERLKRHIRTSDTVARVGGDEFIILAPGTMSEGDREAFLQRVEKAVADPIIVAGIEIDMTASIGAACFPDDAWSTEELLKLADARMYGLKSGRRPVGGSEGAVGSAKRAGVTARL